MLQFNRDMTDEYIKEVLKFHFKRSNKGEFSIEGKYDIYIERRDSIFYAIEFNGVDDDDEFSLRTYADIVKYIRSQFVYISIIEGMRK